MDHPFQTRGRTVELLRYEARYIDRFSGEAVSQGFPAKAEAEKAVARFGVDGKGTVAEQDMSALAWLEGLEVDSFDEAVAIWEQGEAACRARLADAAQKSPDQLRADVDFISVMTGVELV